MFLFKKSLKDEDILHGIRAGGTTRRLFENKFYEKYHYLIKQAAFKHKISEDDAQSAYSDAVLTVIEHIVDGRFEGKSEAYTYLYQVFMNKCVDIIRKNTTNKSSVHHQTVGLEEGLPKDEALQRAKLEWLEKGGKADALPSQWAGMILVGDVHPLSVIRYPLILGGSMVLLLLGGGVWWRRKRTSISQQSDLNTT